MRKSELGRQIAEKYAAWKNLDPLAQSAIKNSALAAAGYTAGSLGMPFATNFAHGAAGRAAIEGAKYGANNITKGLKEKNILQFPKAGKPPIVRKAA